MRTLNNKVIKIILILLIFTFTLPIMNYIIEALVGLGRIIGTFIRILATI